MTEERRYLGSDDVERVAALVLQLAAEVHTLRQRLLVAEALLARKGLLTQNEVDTFTAEPVEAPRLDAARDAFMSRLIRVLREDGPSEHPLREEFLRRRTEHSDVV